MGKVCPGQGEGFFTLLPGIYVSPGVGGGSEERYYRIVIREDNGSSREGKRGIGEIPDRSSPREQNLTIGGKRDTPVLPDIQPTVKDCFPEGEM